MTFPQNGIIDDFNRADESPIAGNWLSPITSFGTSPVDLVGNKATISPGGDGEMYWGAETFGPNVEIYATFDFTPESFSNFSLFLGIIDPGLSTFQAYRLRFDEEGRGSIGEISYNGFVEIAAFDYTRQSGGYGFSKVGTTFTAYQEIDGEWVILGSGNNSLFTGTGYIGFELVGFGGLALDNSGGGTTESTGPTFGRSQLLRRKGWL
jgi:hypothetical protein